MESNKENENTSCGDEKCNECGVYTCGEYCKLCTPHMLGSDDKQ